MTAKSRAAIISKFQNRQVQSARVTLNRSTSVLLLSGHENQMDSTFLSHWLEYATNIVLLAVKEKYTYKYLHYLKRNSICLK
jgi:hypothetical protein